MSSMGIGRLRQENELDKNVTKISELNRHKHKEMMNNMKDRHDSHHKNTMEKSIQTNLGNNIDQKI